LAANETVAATLAGNQHQREQRSMRKKDRQEKNIRIGLSGWTYAPWRGHFYPKGLVQKRELSFAADRFPALEVNGTFYGLQKPEVFERWAQAVPDDFLFAIKGSRYITHVLRLRQIATPLSNFMASGLLRLGPKLGPLLWQFPPSFGFDAAVMEDFLKLLPKNTQEAAALARRHDTHLDGRAWVETDAKRPLRHAIEIRHDSFRDPAFVDLLRRYGVALVCADTADWPRLMDLTADFVYCRLHGSKELYRSRYDEPDLERWAARIRAWRSGQAMRDGDFAGDPKNATDQPRDVFLFFDNTDKRHAPQDAATLMHMLELTWPEGAKRDAA
jgi:uncharacterized protein YecE (DUF72 family)